MSIIIAIASLVGVAAFSAAAFLTVSMLVRRSPGRSSMPYIALAASMSLYAFVSVSNFLQYAGVTGYLDLYEDYAELLFAPLLVLAVFAMEAEARFDERSRSANMLQKQNDLLMSVVDTSPIGIMIVAPGGHITFANDPARNLLAIDDDPATGLLKHAPWTMADPAGADASLGDLVGTKPVSGARRLLTWPNGRREQFLFNVTPMNDANRALGGAVVTVEAASSR